MDGEQKLIALLENMEESNRKQLSYAKFQFIFSAVAMLCCAALLIGGLTLLPKIMAIVSEAEIIVQNLEGITAQLSETELTDMLNNINELVGDVDDLVTTSQTGVEQTMSKINAIDFDALNQAIKDLSDVIEPLVTVVKRLPFI